MASSKQSVAVMRTHPLFVTFERRWQLPVYFQLRWKEIIGKLEDTLSSTQLESTSTRGGKGYIQFIIFLTMGCRKRLFRKLPSKCCMDGDTLLLELRGVHSRSLSQILAINSTSKPRPFAHRNFSSVWIRYLVGSNSGWMIGCPLPITFPEA